MAISIVLIINILLAVTAASCIGYVILYLKPSKKVLLLRPRDHRGKTLSVIQETDLALTCKAVKGVTHRFIKYGASWVFSEGGKMVTRFLGIEGTAYTAIASLDQKIDVSVSEFLEAIWGTRFYKAIPAKQRKIIEEDKIGLTIEIKKLDAETAGLPTLTSSDINDEDDNVVLGKLAKPQKQSTSQTIIGTIINFALGAAVMYFIVKQGYL